MAVAGYHTRGMMRVPGQGVACRLRPDLPLSGGVSARMNLQAEVAGGR